MKFALSVLLAGLLGGCAVCVNLEKEISMSTPAKPPDALTKLGEVDRLDDSDIPATGRNRQDNRVKREMGQKMIDAQRREQEKGKRK